MRDEDVRVGMKVVPHSKTPGWTEFDTWKEWNDPATKFFKENGYLIVSGKRENDSIGPKIWLLAGEICDRGDHFLASDFEPYVEANTESETSTDVKIPDKVYIKAIELEINPKVTLLVKELNKSDAPWIATHMYELQARWDEIVELCKLRQQVACRIKGGAR